MHPLSREKLKRLKSHRQVDIRAAHQAHQAHPHSSTEAPSEKQQDASARGRPMTQPGKMLHFGPLAEGAWTANPILTANPPAALCIGFVQLQQFTDIKIAISREDCRAVESDNELAGQGTVVKPGAVACLAQSPVCKSASPGSGMQNPPTWLLSILRKSLGQTEAAVQPAVFQQKVRGACRPHSRPPFLHSWERALFDLGRKDCAEASIARGERPFPFVHDACVQKRRVGSLGPTQSTPDVILDCPSRALRVRMGNTHAGQREAG
jgi:hypothetical protein